MAIQSVQCTLPKEGPDRSYAIYILRGAPPGLKEWFPDFAPSSCLVVAEEQFQDYEWFKAILKAVKSSFLCKTEIIYIRGGEQCKDISQVGRLWSAFQNHGADRRSVVFNIGGGALCDLSGFAAATYMRGVSFVNIPTTLLAQVDASIGGKVAIDHNGVKNMAGSFCQPKAVVIDLESLQTLSDSEYRSGFAEIIKHGLIRDRSYFEELEKFSFDNRNSDSLADLIRRSCEIKSEIVGLDERETGLRKILNFGHTIGHAIESLSHKHGRPLLHGEAISLGMMAEGYLSFRGGLISMQDLERIRALLKKAGLPVLLPDEYGAEEILEGILSDKKNVAGQVKWVLLAAIGQALFDRSIEAPIVRKALEFLRNG